MKIAINTCYGGFGLSNAAYLYLGSKWDTDGHAWESHEKRTSSKLIECIETLGAKANGIYSQIEIIEIPDDVEWEIEDYDGVETVVEKHRRWRGSNVYEY